VSAPVWSAALVRACHDAALAPAGTAIEVVLRHLREAVGADRAFLVDRIGLLPSPAYWPASFVRPDEGTAFSRSVAARALHGERPLFLEDVRREPIWPTASRFVRSPSGRARGPGPDSRRRRAAVLLDSREP